MILWEKAWYECPKCGRELSLENACNSECPKCGKTFVMIAGKNPDGPLDLNKATYLELRRIVGLGDVAARSIISNRRDGYVFRDVREILKCRAVGKGTYEKVAGKLFV